VRSVWIGAGWKMNHNSADAEAYALALRRFIENSKPLTRVFIVPPVTVLHRVCSLLKDTSVMVGAQNMHWEERGAHTGEISPLMVKDCGATLVELGHSERRAYFNETDAAVNLKILAALRHGLRPLLGPA
jgi:triosephosphate isomerase